MKKIEIDSNEHKILNKVLKEVRENIKGNNRKVIHKNHHKRNYLEMLNQNEIDLIAVESLLDKLK